MRCYDWWMDQMERAIYEGPVAIGFLWTKLETACLRQALGNDERLTWSTSSAARWMTTLASLPSRHRD